MCTVFAIEKTHTTPFRPQSNAERCHWDWVLMVLYAVMAYRATKHSVTSFTPNFLMFGREVSKPVNLVTGLPPDPEDPPAAPEIVRDALGDYVKRAKKQ